LEHAVVLEVLGELVRCAHGRFAPHIPSGRVEPEYLPYHDVALLRALGEEQELLCQVDILRLLHHRGSGAAHAGGAVAALREAGEWSYGDLSGKVRHVVSE